MKGTIRLGVLVITCCLAQLANAQGFQDIDPQKAAQTSFKFLTVETDPRSAALAGAMTAEQAGSSVAMLHNPATMATMENSTHAAFMRTQFIADIDYNAGTIAFRPKDGAYGVIGVSVMSIDYGTFLGTVRSATEQKGYEDTGNFSPSALGVGLGYARNLSDRFAIGANAKYVYQDLTSSYVDVDDAGDLISKDYNIGTVAFDFGVLYRTGYRSLNFAMAVRNFARELQYEQENFELPLDFRIGLSMNMIDFTSLDPNMHAFHLSVEADRPRDYSEQIRVGGEYLIMNTIALRAGYTYPTDTEGINLGVGLQQHVGTFGFAVNYAYTTYETFDAVHRFGLQLGF